MDTTTNGESLEPKEINHIMFSGQSHDYFKWRNEIEILLLMKDLGHTFSKLLLNEIKKDQDKIILDNYKSFGTITFSLPSELRTTMLQSISEQTASKVFEWLDQYYKPIS